MIKQALLECIGARYGLEMKARNTLIQAGIAVSSSLDDDIMGAVNALEYVNPEFVEQGVAELERIVSRETILSAITVTDKKGINYLPVKALSKLIRLIEFVGGATDSDIVEGVRVRELLDNFQRLTFRCVIDTATKYQRRGWYNRVIESSQAFDDMKMSLGYRVALDNPAICFSGEIDELIVTRADYSTTTINTQSSQIKSLLTALGLCSVVDKDGAPVGKYANKSRVIYNPAFVQLLTKLDNRNRITPRLASIRG